MSESNNESLAWAKIVATYRGSLQSLEEVKRMELHFPQFLSHGLLGSEFRIGVAEDLQKQWFSELYSKPLEAAIKNAGLGDGIKVAFVIEKPSSIAKVAIEEKQVKPKNAQATRRVRALPSTLPLHENYTFKNFVIVCFEF